MGKTRMQYLRKMTEPARLPTASNEVSTKTVGDTFQVGWDDHSAPREARVNMSVDTRSFTARSEQRTSTLRSQDLCGC